MSDKSDNVSTMNMCIYLNSHNLCTKESATALPPHSRFQKACHCFEHLRQQDILPAIGYFQPSALSFLLRETTCFAHANTVYGVKRDYPWVNCGILFVSCKICCSQIQCNTSSTNDKSPKTIAHGKCQSSMSKGLVQRIIFMIHENENDTKTK